MLTCHISHVTFHMSLVACLLSLVTCNLSLVTCRLSLVACHLSLVTCHLSLVTLPGKWSISYVARASLWSLRGCWRFLRGVLVVFDILEVPYIHLGSYVSIFSSLPTWEVFYLLGSPENLYGVLEDVPDSCDFG